MTLKVRACTNTAMQLYKTCTCFRYVKKCSLSKLLYFVQTLLNEAQTNCRHEAQVHKWQKTSTTVNISTTKVRTLQCQKRSIELKQNIFNRFSFLSS